MEDTATDTIEAADLDAHLARTQTSYNAIAGAYAERYRTELVDRPFDRAMICAFAELAHLAGGTVADIGCGPGEVTAILVEQGLDVRGIDLSPAMIALARERNPGVRFDQGTMTDLDLPDGELAGVMASYSIIHIPEKTLPQVFAEFRRVLVPGGALLVAFQVGDQPVHFTEGFGKTLDLEFRRLRPAAVRALLVEAGFEMTAEMVREPVPAEKVQQAYLVARKPE